MRYISAQHRTATKTELSQYVFDDYRLKRYRDGSIQKRLTRKLQCGLYDHEEAMTLWFGLVTQLAKMYCLENGLGSVRRNFSEKLRKGLAQQLANDFKYQSSYTN